MRIEEKVLRRMGREDYGPSELDYVVSVITAYNEEVAARRKAVFPPSKDVALGGVVTVSGRRFSCVVRPDVWPPSEACRGCDLSRLYLGCADIRCSAFDRRDGRFVWFKEDGGV